jgi:hypothetical protein
VSASSRVPRRGYPLYVGLGGRAGQTFDYGTLFRRRPTAEVAGEEKAPAASSEDEG